MSAETHISKSTSHSLGDIDIDAVFDIDTEEVFVLVGVALDVLVVELVPVLVGVGQGGSAGQSSHVPTNSTRLSFS